MIVVIVISDIITGSSTNGTVVVNSEAGTLVESELGTMVINEDSEDDGTMKSKSDLQQ